MNTLTAETLSPITHNQTPVITTELLAQLYATKAEYIRRNHNRNEGRFIEGKHFFIAKGEVLESLKKSLRPFQDIAPNVRKLILWTERGAARHAKMLETDQAWEVFEKLEDCYFGQHKNRELPAVGLGPLNIDVLLAIRDDKVAFINQYSPGALMTADEALALLKARGWLVMPREDLAGRLMEL
ncbi:ORF6N domain-containing protein [Salmonella enterica]|uniref:ORF6N domain-containing protein n=2 Tax=Salmonella enterica TaxID=28901 RepID=A0A747DA66_SALER|nr:ORF6N domain-containing protein [Salmonella enterica]ECW9664968.1 ORF6N domain-containing protein [Salmonella enterica subsp. enterica serovar Poona]EDQ3989746.1 ORF6N domain-containing protein [Salmonella enterica subsp. enterica serovar Abaetetuba]EDT0680977.1 ORF6N domain-containing protein [Salmonella enterica subsp. enterica serovar Urbana]EDX3298369.1 ORF6N domain-containing protein [Salmonella enterica subsp. enterica serovar Irumu]ELJ2725297.1 ORF6N domain-containing protein [Salmon